MADLTEFRVHARESYKAFEFYRIWTKKTSRICYIPVMRLCHADIYDCIYVIIRLYMYINSSFGLYRNTYTYTVVESPEFDSALFKQETWNWTADAQSEATRE